jgi:hypothetical protein
VILPSCLAWGLALQAVGVGIPMTVALRLATKDGVLGSFTHYTVRLAWHEMLRSRADVALLPGCRLIRRGRAGYGSSGRRTPIDVVRGGPIQVTP